MAKKAERRRSVRRASERYATLADIQVLREILDARKESIRELEHGAKVQFERTVQIQAELDALKDAFQKARADKKP